MRRGRLGLLLLLLFLSVWRPAAAQEPTPVPDDAVNEIARDLYCPVCPNTPLDVCETQACVQWRELIRQMLAEGRSEEEIKTYFVERYGDRVLATPPPRGLNWLVYLLPPLALLAGAGLLVRSLRGRRQPSQPPPPPPEDPYVARLEEELRRWEEGE